MMWTAFSRRIYTGRSVTVVLPTFRTGSEVTRKELATSRQHETLISEGKGFIISLFYVISATAILRLPRVASYAVSLLPGSTCGVVRKKERERERERRVRCEPTLKVVIHQQHGGKVTTCGVDPRRET